MADAKDHKDGWRSTFAVFALLLAIAALLAMTNAAAGSVRPDLEARLAGLPAGAFIPVIVELEARADPAAAAAGAGAFDRRARGRAVVQALRDVAARTQPPVLAQLAREQADGEARELRPYWVFNGFAVTATAPAIRRLAARGDVREIRYDKPIPPPVPKPSGARAKAGEPAWNLEMIRVPEVWALNPAYTGTGVVVGSFDTGVDGNHPDLAPRYRGNHAISWFDPYGEHASPYDNNGHGTHTTGTVVGGDASGYSIGVAPGARWIAAKAWNDSDAATESAFHQIFEWFLAPGGDPANAPDVVNNSWGLVPALCYPDFLSAVQAFRAAGIVPVFAAGNEGPDPGTVLAPGSYAEAFTVGATDFDDEIAFFSGQGPSSCDGAVKPNISAPGVLILSTFPGGDYVYLDGTSMATPHVTGAAALLLSIDPALTVEEVEAALVAGAVDRGPTGPDNAFGYGRLDVMESARIVLGLESVRIVATTPTALEAGTVAGAFTVSRTGSTADPLAVAYTVSGTALPGSDYVALSGSVTIPAGSASVVLAVTPIDDTLGEIDETVTVTLDPHPDYVVGPAQATVTIVSDEVPPDLVVAALGAPAASGAGEAVTLTDTTRNQGAAPSTPSLTSFFLSANALLDAGDIALGSRAVPALAAGASSTGSVTLTIPAATQGGAYWIVAKADGDDALVETQEGNNVLTRAILIGPDLQLSSVTVPANGGAGLALTVGDTTRNAGAGGAAPSTTSFYLSADATLDAGDVPLGSRAVPALASGATDSGAITVTIPADTATGSYYLFVRADAGGVVAETYENNNTTSRTLRVGPDLLMSALTVPASAGAGAPITLNDTTRNAGGGTAAPSTTRFYLSANSLLDAGDVLLGGRAVPELAPLATNAGSVSLAIPADTPGGTYYVIAQADGEGVVGETQETNNVIARSLLIGPDLQLAGVTVPTDGGAGLALTLGDTTRNAGAGGAPASTTSFYLSANSLLDAADVLLGSRAVAALAAGASDAGSITVTIPAGTATGTYYVIARADAGDAIAETYENNNTASRTLRVGPDLLVSTLAVPASAGAGAAIAITDTTRNAGGGTAAPSTTRFYLSTNSLLDASDVLLGGRALAALAPGANDSGTVSVTIPAETPGGAYYVIAQADGEAAVSETQEGNNVLSRSLLIGPDLGIASVTAPADGGAGFALTLGDTTRNTGAGSAAPSTTSFYLSANATLDAGDVLLGSRAVPALAAGATNSGSIAVTIPADTATGTYYLFVRADADDAIAETYENNNTASRTLRVGPDLLMSALTVPASAGAGATITVTDTTRNAGGGTAAASTTRYYLSTNSLLDAGDVLLGGRAVPALAPLATNAGSASLVIPAGTAGGSYYVLAQADGEGVVGETQENNNVIARNLLVGPDLTLSSVTVPATGGAGLALTLGDTTRNGGAGSAPATTTSFYLSANAILDAGDVLLGSRDVAALAAGASDAGSITVTIPADTATGSYYLFVRADATDAVGETYENNNTASRTLRVGPDLLMSALTVPASAAAGSTITVTDTTRNAGGGGAPASTTRYYLSTNSLLDAGDVLLGARAVAPLGPLATESGSASLVIPAGTASATWYVIAQADGEGAVGETQETNNTLYRSFQVTAP